MAKYRDGEYIALVFDWSDHPEFVKGHVDLESAQAAMNAHHGDDKFKVTKCEWEWTGPLYPIQPKEARTDA